MVLYITVRTPSVIMVYIYCLFVVLTLWMQGVKPQGCSNLALLKPAKDSVLENTSNGPEHAVDGVNITLITDDNICSHVWTYGISGWWEVDLQVTVRVGSVRITTAEYVYGRPKDFLLEVYPDPICDAAPRVCHQYSGTLPGAETVSIDCSTPVRGRTVRLTQVDPFFLCEFEVFQAVEQEELHMNFRDIMLIKYPGMKKTFASSLEIETVSAFDCGRECISHGMCPFFNYKIQGGVGTCEIPSFPSCINSSDVPSNIVDWDYYEEDPCSP